MNTLIELVSNRNMSPLTNLRKAAVTSLECMTENTFAQTMTKPLACNRCSIVDSSHVIESGGFIL